MKMNWCTGIIWRLVSRVCLGLLLLIGLRRMAAGRLLVAGGGLSSVRVLNWQRVLLECVHRRAVIGLALLFCRHKKTGINRFFYARVTS